MGQRAARTGVTLISLAFLAIGFAVPFGGCTVDLEGEGAYDRPCAGDAQCEDGNACTLDLCGPNGMCSVTIDSAGVPDDGNDCTSDRCDGLSAVHEVANEGAVCKDGANSGFCRTGECVVACTPETEATACDDENPCTLDSCDLTSGKCVRVKLDGTATPGTAQKVGDCSRDTCVKGVAEKVIDDTDLPVNVECWEESCSGGIPATEPSVVDAACGWDKTLKCDGAGKCVGCTSNDQCAKDDCNDGVCNAGACELDSKPPGTPLPDSEQTEHDCQSVQCDGAGTAQSVEDNNDAPVPDSAECTRDECVGGVPLHPPRAPGAACSQDSGAVCDGAGACVECNDAAHCTDPGECSTRACTGHACIIAPKPEGQTCGTQGVCDGAGVCVGCTKATDCPDPGECQHAVCTSNLCGSAPDPKDQVCTSGFCDAAGKCVQCNVAAQCPSGNACQDARCNNNVCSLAAKPAGTTCPTGVCNATATCVQCIASTGCPDPGECESPVCNNGSCGTVNDGTSTTCGTGQFCDGTGNCVECNTAAQCTGGTVCLPVVCNSNTCGEGTPAPRGTVCDAAAGKACDGSGECKLIDGKTCTSGDRCVSGNCVDGVCCDTACDQKCYACSAAKKGQGVDGSCGVIRSGSDPDDECSGSHVCNGSGACT